MKVMPKYPRGYLRLDALAFSLYALPHRKLSRETDWEDFSRISDTQQITFVAYKLQNSSGYKSNWVSNPPSLHACVSTDYPQGFHQCLQHGSSCAQELP